MNKMCTVKFGDFYCILTKGIVWSYSPCINVDSSCTNIEVYLSHGFPDTSYKRLDDMYLYLYNEDPFYLSGSEYKIKNNIHVYLYNGEPFYHSMYNYLGYGIVDCTDVPHDGSIQFTGSSANCSLYYSVDVLSIIDEHQ
ncbi:hypothetical protein Cyrtocomes_00168 [Candidatus Cyrtobacter comes]|uniref:Uncharacterized protein n=1 Tax=Candidatus Cyrtobacter comes TaxID=675776 RepID=A0ABU5L7E2_9RICK|nr:hypothetical protein [Candidatus Cyrtobacter comes]